MDRNDKYYLAHTLKSIAGGFLFLFLAGFVISAGPDLLQWIALAGSVGFALAGSFVKASADLDATLSKYDTPLPSLDYSTDKE